MGWFDWLWPARKGDGPALEPHQRTDPTMPAVEPAPAAAALPPEPASARSAPAVASEPAPEPLDALPWLLKCGPLTDTRLSSAEQDALIVLDRTLALPAIPDNLLPRAAALIPQLIALLRHTELPVPAIAERIGKDPVLTAELMRLASSPYYRVQGDVANLEQAISLIGLRGLQTVMARVLLKPIYHIAPGPLSGRAGARMWEHSEALARHTAILSEPAGQSVFDGYLAGMLHDTGWTVALTALDRARITLALPPSVAFAALLDDRVHRLFGHVTQKWAITPGFTELAHDARANGPSEGVHPLAKVLQLAHQRCLEELLAP